MKILQLANFLLRSLGGWIDSSSRPMLHDAGISLLKLTQLLVAMLQSLLQLQKQAIRFVSSRAAIFYKGFCTRARN
jgi:hypothetical protein